MSPTPTPSRRRLLGAGLAGMAGLTGCAALSDPTPTVDLTVFSDVQVPYEIEFQAYRADADHPRSEARVFDASVSVPADGEVRRRDVAAAVPLLVRYQVYRDGSTLTDRDHVHYLPPDEPDPLVFDLEGDGVLRRR